MGFTNRVVVWDRIVQTRTADMPGRLLVAVLWVLAFSGRFTCIEQTSVFCAVSIRAPKLVAWESL